MLRLAILSGLLAIATVTWGQEAVGPVGAVLTLEQAVALALQNNRQVQNASLEVGKKIDQAAAARTSRLPAFNVYFLESYLFTPLEFTFRVLSEHFPARDRFRPDRQDDPHRAAARDLCRHPGDSAAVAALPPRTER